MVENISPDVKTLNRLTNLSLKIITMDHLQYGRWCAPAASCRQSVRCAASGSAPPPLPPDFGHALWQRDAHAELAILKFPEPMTRSRMRACARTCAWAAAIRRPSVVADAGDRHGSSWASRQCAVLAGGSGGGVQAWSPMARRVAGGKGGSKEAGGASSKFAFQASARRHRPAPQFREGVARAEFGRFYWDERRQQGLKNLRNRKK